MENPYSNLHIYYFEGTPELPKDLERDHSFLGTWVDDDVSFLFFSSEKDDLVKQINPSKAGAKLIDTYRMTCEQWHGDKIEPYCIENLCICPPWDVPKINESDVKKVLLDPGVVFGTGRHQTTEDCLYLIQRLCTRDRINTILDIGTGTGLLAVGAAALGCDHVFACDFNFLAVKTALNNVRLNGFEERILTFQARGEQVMSLPCDLLVANIHYDVMQHMIQNPGLLNPKWLVLSGLLNSEAEKVIQTLRAKKVNVIERRCPDGVWNTLLCRTEDR